MTAGYKRLEHTADVALQAWGDHPAEAFAAAAQGMFTIQLGDEPPWVTLAGKVGALRVTVTGAGWPDLLVNWLAELLYLFDVEGFVPQAIAVTDCGPDYCAASLNGVYLDPGQGLAGVGLKTVTHHQLTVDVQPDRTELHVIFDS